MGRCSRSLPKHLKSSSFCRIWIFRSHNFWVVFHINRRLAVIETFIPKVFKLLPLVGYFCSYPCFHRCTAALTFLNVTEQRSMWQCKTPKQSDWTLAVLQLPRLLLQQIFWWINAKSWSTVSCFLHHSVVCSLKVIFFLVKRSKIMDKIQGKEQLQHPRCI